MKKTVYLSIIGALLAFSSLHAEETLPPQMKAVSTGIQLTTMDVSNRAKCTKPLVKLPDGSLMFTATAATTGEELYICKDEQVTLIKDIVPGAGGSDPKFLTVVGDKVYFTTITPEYGEELWMTDGTDAGTKLVKDINEGTEGSYVYGLTAFQDKCLFFARDFDSMLDPVIDSQTPEEWLWVSDGTDAGTMRIADVPTRKQSNAPDGNAGHIVPCGNQAFFVGYDKVNNQTLYVTDGTASGTRPVTNINPKPSTGGNFQTEPGDIDWLTNMNDEKVIFRANTVKEKVGGTKDLGSEIWFSDGTDAGTKWVGVDYAPGEVDGVPNNTQFAFPLYYNGKAYFRAIDGVHGCEPGVTDFTPEGTHYICDINYWNNDPSQSSWGPEHSYIWKGFLFCQANGSYYYPADTYNDSGYSLWRYNLAEGGVTPTPENGLKGYEYQKNWTNGFEVFPGNNSDGPRWFTECGGRLYLILMDAVNNWELWKMESVDDIPKKVVDLEGNTVPYFLTAVNNSLYFVTTTTKTLYKYAPEAITSIDDVKYNQNSLSVYYNKTNSSIECKSEVEIQQVQIIDLTGKYVFSQQGYQSAINVSSLPSGLYIVCAKAVDGTLMSAKFIK